MEAEDADNLSDDIEEDLDANSDDKEFIDEEVEDTEEEGELCTRNELMALQPHLWEQMQKIVIRGKSSELAPLQVYSRNIIFHSTSGSNWIFRLFENKLGNTFFHAFLLRSDSLPDPELPVDTTDAERLDFNIIIEESIKKLEISTSLNIRTFVVYKKICALEFMEMIFNKFPRVSKVLYPSSHKGLETAIKKSVFSYVNEDYIINRPVN